MINRVQTTTLIGQTVQSLRALPPTMQNLLLRSYKDNLPIQKLSIISVRVFHSTDKQLIRLNSRSILLQRKNPDNSTLIDLILLNLWVRLVTTRYYIYFSIGLPSVCPIKLHARQQKLSNL